MSYAAVAGSNIPAGEMPEPSQDLRDGLLAGDDEPSSGKLNASTGSEDPEWEKEKADVKKDVKDTANKAEKHAKEFKKKAKTELNAAENNLAAYWDRVQDVIFRPATVGGLFGVVNVGLLGGLGYLAYINRDRPWDQRTVGGAIAGTLALFTAEGYVAESYLETPEGRQEAERAKREGSKLYLQAKEVILRPGIAGGLAGAFNIAVIGTVTYFAHKHWNQPWDRKVVGGVAAGLIALSGIEGVLGQQYVDKELPKR